MNSPGHDVLDLSGLNQSSQDPPESCEAIEPVGGAAASAGELNPELARRLVVLLDTIRKAQLRRLTYEERKTISHLLVELHELLDNDGDDCT